MRVFLFASAAVLFASSAVAQAPNPACQRLEAQLTNVDRGTDDPARADQIRRAEDALNRQQFELDRNVAQARRMGCESTGFFSIFSSVPPQCGGLNRQIDQQRSAIERARNDLEQLNGGTAQRAEARRTLLIALANNGCGPQYRQAALSAQQGGFFDRLFGTNSGPFSPSGPMGSTFRTVCVRSCDGFYFPISFSTTQDHFRDDEASCQRMCPAAEVSLYSYHNPGEDMSQAVSLNGRLYSELPTAFQYRKTLSSACGCRRPGESWADALKVNGPDDTVAPGDVVVTDQNAKRLSQPRATDGKPLKPVAKQPEPSDLVQAPGEPDPAKRSVRTVGPTFLPVR